ncbi:MAG: nitronate monooxygenase, partial [Desulfovibrionaceae bacterium]|nr:nitronate monooxygenase [Desulfovibrionaceae bacterium]
PKLAAKVTKAVREGAPNKHIIIKLSPNVTNIASIAQSVEGEGCDSISCINTLQGLSVNLKTRRPNLANIIGGLSGPAIKPVALRCVWQVVKAVKIPVIGVGGIVSAQDVLEFILVGAQAIEVGTANFMNPKTAFELTRTLPKLCQELDIASLSDFRGSLKVD